MLHEAEENSNLNRLLNSPLLRRLRGKFIGRLATTYLPPAPSVSRSSKNRKSLFGQADETASQYVEVIDAEFEVPEEVEALLGGLMNSLSDSVSSLSSPSHPYACIKVAETRFLTGLSRSVDGF